MEANSHCTGQTHCALQDIHWTLTNVIHALRSSQDRHSQVGVLAARWHTGLIRWHLAVPFLLFSFMVSVELERCQSKGDWPCIRWLNQAQDTVVSPKAIRKRWEDRVGHWLNLSLQGNSGWVLVTAGVGTKERFPRNGEFKSKSHP